LEQIKIKQSKLRTITCWSAAVLLSIVLTVAAVHGYRSGILYWFETITRDQVYKSGVIPPDKLEKFINRYNIRTIIDLRTPARDSRLNPGKQNDIDLEHKILTELGVRHINIPSPQVPPNDAVEAFLEVMDDEGSKPVLIHCFHGRGRAVLFSAIYRIEYEGWDNERARRATRMITWGSSFSKNTSKGIYLLDYIPRTDTKKQNKSKL